MFAPSSLQILLTLLMTVALLGLIVYRRYFAQPPANKTPAEAKFDSLTARMGFNNDVVLHVAASLANASDNRLAQAIVSEASKNQVPIKTVSEFKTHTGYGLTGVVDGRIIALGSHTLMNELGIKTQIDHEQISQNIAPNIAILYVSINSYWAGIITVFDEQTHSF